MPDIPEITPAALARKREEGTAFTLLDVREPRELQAANLGPDVAVAPMSALIREGPGALPPAVQDKQAELVVFCHHGVRSAQVVAWLQQLGWQDVWNLRGGIDAYAREVDPAVGLY